MTGHSLGGALATLAAARHQADVLWTFGAPRVGDALFARSLAGTAIGRVVNGNDPVPAVPPPGRPWRFRHPGRPFLLRGGTMLRPRSVPSGTAARALIASLLARRRARSSTFGEAPAALADHAPINYTRHLAWIISEKTLPVR